MNQRRKPGRNDQCSCGSGKKFKNCCESKTRTRSSRLLLFTILGIVAAAIAIGVVSVSRSGGEGGPARVWSQEHGHYHDVR